MESFRPIPPARAERHKDTRNKNTSVHGIHLSAHAGENYIKSCLFPQGLGKVSSKYTFRNYCTELEPEALHK